MTRLFTTRPGTTSHGLRCGLAALAIVASVAAGGAAEPPLNAAAVLDRYVASAGGVEAFEAISSRVTRGTLEIPAQGVSLDLTIWEARPTSSYTLVESQMTGRIESGISGDVAWESSVMAGPRLKTGEERDDALFGAEMDRYTHWREHFESVEYAGEATVAGARCDKLVLTPGGGRPPQELYFDKDSGLLVRADVSVRSPAGTVPLETTIGDYREVGGVRLPYRMEVEVLGQHRIITVGSIELNPEVPADLFTPPADVLELMARSEAAAAPTQVPEP